MLIFVCVACVHVWTHSTSGLHPKDAEVGLLDGCVEGCADAESQNQPGVHRINNPIVPHPVERWKWSLWTRHPAAIPPCRAQNHWEDSLPRCRELVTSACTLAPLTGSHLWVEEEKNGSGRTQRCHTELRAWRMTSGSPATCRKVAITWICFCHEHGESPEQPSHLTAKGELPKDS